MAKTAKIVFIALVMLMCLFAVANAEGKWVTEKNGQCYYLEDGVKSNIHFHLEGEDYICPVNSTYKKSGKWYQLSSCSVCHTYGITVAHSHVLVTEVTSDDTYHYTNTYCDKWCSYKTTTKAKHTFETTKVFNNNENEWVTTTVCTVCNYVKSVEHVAHVCGEDGFIYKDAGHDEYIDETKHVHIFTYKCATCGKIFDGREEREHSFTQREEVDIGSLYIEVHIYMNGNSYLERSCSCGSKKLIDLGPCNHASFYMNNYWKKADNSKVKVCECCGQALSDYEPIGDTEFDENGLSLCYTAPYHCALRIITNYPAMPTVPSEESTETNDDTISPRYSLNPNEVYEGLYEVSEFCHVDAWSKEKGFTTFTQIKYWGIDKYGNVTYELISDNGAIGFAHAENITVIEGELPAAY